MLKRGRSWLRIDLLLLLLLGSRNRTFLKQARIIIRIKTTTCISISPSTDGLREIDNVDMHRSSTKAYNANLPPITGSVIVSSSESFWPIWGITLERFWGVQRRAQVKEVQMQDHYYRGYPSIPRAFTSWFSSIDTDADGSKPTISFADCAPYLIVSETSLHDVSRRLVPDHKFRD